MKFKTGVILLVATALLSSADEADARCRLRRCHRVSCCDSHVKVLDRGVDDAYQPPPAPIEVPQQTIEIPRIVFVRRHAPSDVIYRGSSVAIRSEPSELFIQKNGGPGSVELLLGYELTGDFIVYISAEFATAAELGVDFRGGTPVPYYGLRSSSGDKECYFFLNTIHPKGKRYAIVLSREAGKVSATLDNSPERQDTLAEPGFVCFLMNDVSRVRLHHVRLESPPGNVIVEYGRPEPAEHKAEQP